ncbi:hypothetical protein Jab_1c12400 [Janthinobacterium sp. HH01]|nr:hypothetical protein Jab_1c12400 [Janthinobacterium sp. HH01]
MGFQDTSRLRHYLFVRDGPARRDIRIRVQISLHTLLYIVESILPNFWPEMLWRHLGQGSQALQASAIGGGEGR